MKPNNGRIGIPGYRGFSDFDGHGEVSYGLTLHRGNRYVKCNIANGSYTVHVNHNQPWRAVGDIMRQFFSFWWRCTKIAAKGNSSFANDWQWVYANPIVSGLGAVVIGTIGGAAPSLAHLWGGSEMTTGHPATDAFIGALCAYLV